MMRKDNDFGDSLILGSGKESENGYIDNTAMQRNYKQIIFFTSNNND